MESTKITNRQSLLNYYSISKYRTALMGISAIFIVLFHINSFCTDVYPMNATIDFVLKKTLDLLNIGVDIFLFVSGIGLYFAYEKKPKFKDYIIKRLLNVYIVLLIVQSIWSLFTNVIFASNGIVSFVLDATGLGFVLGINKNAWYVMFAIFLYFVYPLIYKILKKLEHIKYDYILVLGFIIIYCVALYFLKDTGVYSRYEIALTRFPVFLLGCYYGRYVKEKKNFDVLFYAYIIFGILYKAYAMYTNVLFFKRTSSCFFAISVMFLLILIFNVLPKSIIKLLEWFGGISLELYLVHCAINTLVKTNEDLRKIWIYAIIILVSIPISYLLAKFRNYIVGIYLKKQISKA